MFGINFLKDILTASTNLVRKRVLFFPLFAVSVKAQLENASMTVVNPMNITASSITPYAIQQANNSHLWFAGASMLSSAVNGDLIFSEVANGTLLSTITLGGVGDQTVKNFIQSNNSFVFTGWSNLAVGSPNYHAILGKLTTDSSTISWLNVFGGNNAEYGYSVVERNGGGYTLAGYTFSFSAVYPVGMILAFDDDGNRIWSNTVGESASYYIMDFINTNDGGYAGVGFTTSIIASVYNMIVYKFDSNGSLLWSKKLGGAENDFTWSIVELTNGHLTITGSTQSFGAVGKAIVIVELDNLGNLVSGEMIDGPGDEEANVVLKTTQGIKLGGYTTSYGIGNPKKMFIVDMYANKTLSNAITFEGSGNDVITGMRPTSDGGFAFTGTYNQSSVVGKSDIYGEFPSNCTTRVTPTVIDITANITVSTPNITAVPFTPTIFNVTFTQKAAPIVAENPCVFTMPPPALVPTPTSTSTPAPVPTASSILSGSTSATTTFVTPISSSTASISTPSSSSPSSSTISAISSPITFNVIATTDPIVIESGTPTTLSINALSFTGNANPEQLVFTVLGNNPDLVITVDGVEGASLFTYAQLEGGFVSLELPGMTCGQYSDNLQLEATVTGSNAAPQQVNVALIFEGTTCTTANTGRLLVFSRKQEPKQAIRPMESREPVLKFKY